MYCSNCFKDTSENREFCKYCGAKFGQYITNERTAIKLTKEERNQKLKEFKESFRSNNNPRSHKTVLFIFGILMAIIILPNLFIIPLVLYNHSQGYCVMYVARGSSLDSCGALNNPLYNIFAMNAMYWAVIVFIAILRFLGNIFSKR